MASSTTDRSCSNSCACCGSLQLSATPDPVASGGTITVTAQPVAPPGSGVVASVSGSNVTLRDASSIAVGTLMVVPQAGVHGILIDAVDHGTNVVTLHDPPGPIPAGTSVTTTQGPAAGVQPMVQGNFSGETSSTAAVAMTWTGSLWTTTLTATNTTTQPRTFIIHVTDHGSGCCSSVTVTVNGTPATCPTDCSDCPSSVTVTFSGFTGACVGLNGAHVLTRIPSTCGYGTFGILACDSVVCGGGVAWTVDLGDFGGFSAGRASACPPLMQYNQCYADFCDLTGVTCTVS